MIDTLTKSLQWLHKTFVDRSERVRREGREKIERWARFFEEMASALEQARSRIIAHEIPQREYALLNDVIKKFEFEMFHGKEVTFLDDDEKSDLFHALDHATQSIWDYDCAQAPWSTNSRAYMEAVAMRKDRKAKRLAIVLSRDLETSIGQFQAIALKLRTISAAGGSH